MCGLALVATVALSGACLPDDPPVRGRRLYSGVGISNPRFRVMDGEPWVLFDVRTARGENGMGSRMDLHLARFSDGHHQLALVNRAARDEWPVLTDADRAGFYMTDERPAVGLGLSVGTLVRLRLASGVVETIPDVLSYGLHPDRRWFYYRKYVPGAAQPELHLRDLQGNDRNLGFTGGPVSFFGPEAFYFIGGPERVLTRVNGLEGPPVPLRAQVSRFWLDGQQRFAVLAVSDEGRAHTRVLDLATGEEKSLPVDHPCCWLGLERDVFTYAEEASEGQPAALHRFDVAAGIDNALPLPVGLDDVQAILHHPERPEALLLDRNRRAAVLRGPLDADPATAPALELLPRPLNAPVFTDDGRHLLFLEVEPPPPPPAIRRSVVGRLMVQDTTDWSATPRLVSPVGTTCLVQPRGYVTNVGGPTKVLFWAHYGLGATDLYLSDLDTGETRKLAVGVGPMTMIQTRLLGIARIGQDHTGDLVQKDLLTGEEQVLEHGVVTLATHSDPTVGEIAAFIVKERNDTSPRNGLWATPIPPF